VVVVAEEIPGMDVAALRPWLAERLSGRVDPAAELGAELIAGGRSNLTYRLTYGDADVVLRRPPLGHVLPTAHDMGREYRVLSALRDSDVPVPCPIGLCTDDSVLGTPFYVMEHVDGRVLRTADDAADIGESAADLLCERLVRTLVAIHSVDVEAAGLAGFGRPDGYLERQVRRWQQQWDRSKTRDLPAYDALVRRLTRHLPPNAPGALVHGDYRLDNALVRLDPEPEVAAVVDWEMSTLGDPLADLGLTLTYWADAGDEERGGIPVGATVTAAPGFWSGARFAARYAELTGRDTGDIAYYVAFGHFKLAVILEGIHARYLQNATVGEGFATIGASVPLLVDRANRVLDDAGLG
jgi:aminoglycoside phosphotransferase (APT) family kinase protein